MEHRRWEVYPVREHRIAANFGSLYGPDFAGLRSNQPDHVLLAEGAPVRIRWGGRIAGGMGLLTGAPSSRRLVVVGKVGMHEASGNPP